MQSSEEIESRAHFGEHQSLTKALNVVKKLRAMGAVRMSVGDIAVDFQEEIKEPAVESEDVLEVNDLEDFKSIERWAKH